jgi:hypothetical protein
VRAKCEVILSDTTREYRLDLEINERLSESGMTVDQLAFAEALASAVSLTIHSATALLTCMELGSESTYLQLSHNFVELKGHEQAFDVIIEEIKKDRCVHLAHSAEHLPLLPTRGPFFVTCTFC